MPTTSAQGSNPKKAHTLSKWIAEICAGNITQDDIAAIKKGYACLDDDRTAIRKAIQSQSGQISKIRLLMRLQSRVVLLQVRQDEEETPVRLCAFSTRKKVASKSGDPTCKKGRHVVVCDPLDPITNDTLQKSDSGLVFAPKSLSTCIRAQTLRKVRDGGKHIGDVSDSGVKVPIDYLNGPIDKEDQQQILALMQHASDSAFVAPEGKAPHEYTQAVGQKFLAACGHARASYVNLSAAALKAHIKTLMASDDPPTLLAPALESGVNRKNWFDESNYARFETRLRGDKRGYRRYVPVPTVEQLAVGAEVDFFWGNEADMHSGVCDHKWKPGTLVVLGADSSTVDVRHQVNPGAPGHVTKAVNLSRIRLLQQYRELARHMADVATHLQHLEEASRASRRAAASVASTSRTAMTRRARVEKWLEKRRMREIRNTIRRKLVKRASSRCPPADKYLSNTIGDQKTAQFFVTLRSKHSTKVTLRMTKAEWEGKTASTLWDVTHLTVVGVEEILEHACKECTSLVSVNFPQATTIGSRAFSGCTSLTTVAFPLATTIGYRSFERCTLLTTVECPLATTIGFSAFERCTLLTTVECPLATTIGFSAFECTSLTTVNFPQATTLGAYAFSECTALTTADFPKAITLGNHAFSKCTSLTTADFPQAITLGQNAFFKCKALTTADFPQVTTLNNYAFSECKALTTANFPKVTRLGSYVINGCTSLTTAVFPPNVRHI
jgi:hypothetical protein